MTVGTVQSLEPVEDCFQTKHNVFIPSELIASRKVMLRTLSVFRIRRKLVLLGGDLLLKLDSARVAWSIC